MIAEALGSAMQRKTWLKLFLCCFKRRAETQTAQLLPQSLQLWTHNTAGEIREQELNLSSSHGWHRSYFMWRSYLVTFFLLNSSSSLPPLASPTAFSCNQRTTEQLPEVPNPYSHQPASCLCLPVTHQSFWAFSSITFPSPQMCKIINVASDQIFSRLPPFHHKLYCSYTFSWPTFLTSNPFSAALMTILPLRFAFPRFFNDATYFLPLPFLSLLFLVLTISLLSLHRWFYTPFSHLFHRLYVLLFSTQPTLRSFILTFDFEATFNKI